MHPLTWRRRSSQHETERTAIGRAQADIMIHPPEMHPFDDRFDEVGLVGVDDGCGIRTPHNHPIWPIDHIGVTKDSGDGERARRRPHLAGRAGLMEATALHHADTVTEGKRLIVIVGDMDRGRSRRIQDLREVADQPIPEVPVERTERLVKQQNPGPRGQRPSECHPLGLTPRQGGDRPSFKASKPNQLEEFTYPRRTGRRVNAIHPQTKLDVLPHRAMREQGMVLEHQPERSALGR